MMTANPFRRHSSILAILGLFTSCVCALRTSAADVTLAGKVFDPAGTALADVAVTAYLRSGTQKSTNTSRDGSYKLSVPVDLVVAMEFSHKLYAPTPLDSLAGLANGQINVVVGMTPNTASDVVLRLAHIEALHFRAALGQPDTVPEQARTYLRESSATELNNLRKQVSKIKLPVDIMRELDSRIERLGTVLRRWH